MSNNFSNGQSPIRAHPPESPKPSKSFLSPKTSLDSSINLSSRPINSLETKEFLANRLVLGWQKNRPYLFTDSSRINNFNKNSLYSATIKKNIEGILVNGYGEDQFDLNESSGLLYEDLNQSDSPENNGETYKHSMIRFQDSSVQTNNDMAVISKVRYNTSPMKSSVFESRMNNLSLIEDSNGNHIRRRGRYQHRNVIGMGSLPINSTDSLSHLSLSQVLYSGDDLLSSESIEIPGGVEKVADILSKGVMTSLPSLFHIFINTNRMSSFATWMPTLVINTPSP